MLYITTRDNKDAYTAFRALHENTAPDGGGFIPFHTPVFSVSQLEEFVPLSFGQTVAELLNRFFSCKLTGWDIDICIGRSAVKLATMAHRIVIAEMWHNPEGVYERVIDNLFAKIVNEKKPTTEWFKVAAHIAILFGIYTELCRNEIISFGDTIDFTTMADDLTIPVAAVYARKMGLPVDTIIFTCEDNGGLWDLIHLGELHYSSKGANLLAYERLVHTAFGCEGVTALCIAINQKKSYRIDDELLPVFNAGLFCSVTGKARSAQNINSIYRTNSYLLDPITAQCIGGLQDYRAKTGESKLTLMIAGESPMNCISKISEATGISREKLSSVIEEYRYGGS